MGTISLIRSIAYRHASNAASRWAEATLMTTLASPTAERADAMNDGHVVDAPTFPNLVADLRHGQFGGRRIRFVFEMRHRSPAAVVAHGPDERRDGAGSWDEQPATP